MLSNASFPIQFNVGTSASSWRILPNLQSLPAVLNALDVQPTLIGCFSGAGRILTRDAIFSPAGKRNTNTLNVLLKK